MRLLMLCLSFAAVVCIAGCGDSEAKSGVDHVRSIAGTARSQEIDCGDERLRGALVILALGQSNAANHGQSDELRPPIAVFHNGRCWLASDPLPGGTGGGASVWSHLAPRLSRLLGGRPILFSLLAIDATSSRDWAENPLLTQLVDDKLADLLNAGLGPDAVLWQQGEADAKLGVSEEEYVDNVQHVLQGIISAFPLHSVFVAVSTRCGSGPNKNIQSAQLRLPNLTEGVIPGPNLDLIGQEDRIRDCHFNSAGLNSAAELWIAVLNKHFNGKL